MVSGGLDPVDEITGENLFVWYEVGGWRHQAARRPEPRSVASHFIIG
jgi:hypothetical protein